MLSSLYSKAVPSIKNHIVIRRNPFYVIDHMHTSAGANMEIHRRLAGAWLRNVSRVYKCTEERASDSLG